MSSLCNEKSVFVIVYRYYGGDDDYIIFPFVGECTQELEKEVMIYNHHIDSLGMHPDTGFQLVCNGYDVMNSLRNEENLKNIAYLPDIIQDSHDPEQIPPSLGYRLLPETQRIIDVTLAIKKGSYHNFFDRYCVIDRKHIRDETEEESIDQQLVSSDGILRVPIDNLGDFVNWL
jgi:hypothetical protein|uniref:Uncharacterized protein n=1 Tax=viral metagenome TaxID=1070528 RepID=A0A6C0BJV2_9ZZZZ